MNGFIRLLASAGLLLAAGASAQIGSRLPVIGGTLRDAQALALPGQASPVLSSLAATQRDRFRALVRAHPAAIALDPAGFPARAHEVVAIEPDALVLAAAKAHGFALIERIDTLGIVSARFATPPGLSLKSAIRLLTALGAKDVSADPLLSESGAATGAAPIPAADTGPVIGIIDGGVAGSVFRQRGFATGAPRASDHATAIASLITGSAAVRGAAPRARLAVADVYGTDPAGGSATAIVKALGWLVEDRVPVVTISLVGPANPLLARVVAAAQARGTIIVAAVGNDGPSAPPGYPASYPGVIAVTGVDGRDRILIEAGRAAHLDYAAPGADMVAVTAGGGVAPVRGTSFAAPLAAALIADVYRTPDPARRAAALASVDAHARKMGPRYGRGLVCADCRTLPR